MMAALKDFADRLLGRGDATITVPSFDGALKPNQILEKAETLAQLDAPEDLATDGKALYIADGPVLGRLDGADVTELRRFDRNITALCCLPDGGLAVALDGREVQVFVTPLAAAPSATITDPSMTAINALSPGPAGTLLATDGSSTRPYGQWAHDLMERGRSGRVLSAPSPRGRITPSAPAPPATISCSARAGGTAWWRSRRTAASAPCSTICRSTRRGCRQPVRAASGSPPSRLGRSSSNSCCARTPTVAA
jgi:hypothetical protein